ncbi:MAG: flagellar hook-associated protein FlgK [Azoarcus sp.]|jgi:flagellar hook-associated protein 1 FlgK|nr:flagellar hook-associated protein FlgK [Azoarcus sp.]
MAGLLNIGLTGVNAAQGQLVTTSHNIANADTAGYHRQRVIQASQSPYYSGVGFFGNGTKITTVTRAYDQFLENQVLSASAHMNQYSAFVDQISQIDNLLADPTAGISAVLDEFFAGVQEVAANPTDSSARQALISSAQALVSRFHSLDSTLTEIREGVEYEISSTVNQINTLASSIAELNQRIVVAQSASTSQPANDLLDQRNELVAQLNDLIQVTTKVESDGTLSVFIGTGQSLIQSNHATKLGVIQGANDPTQYDVAMMPIGGAPIRLPERLVTGGQLAGLLQFRSQSLNSTQNTLGMLAVSIAAAFNNQHELGVDLEGALGQEFFSISSPVTIPSDAATVTFDFNTDPLADDIANLGQLTAADYVLRYDGTNYTIVNKTTGDSKVLAVPQDTFQGLSIDLSASTLAAGESALIQPTRYAARDIKLAITDPRQVAAGCPVIADVPTINAGNAGISAIVMNDVTGVTASGWQATLTFTAPNTLTVTSSGGASFTPATFSFDPTTESAGKTFTLTDASGFEFSFTFAGTPQTGDTFNLQQTQQGVADSRNANLLGALQTKKLLYDNGSGVATSTIGSAYSQLVNKVANKTHEVQTNLDTQTTLYAQTSEARDSLSAVNLDEEAANLIRYQQAYQASARVMTIAEKLFDEIIAIVR